MIGNFLQKIENKELKEIFNNITKDKYKIESIDRICLRYDEATEEDSGVREYDVYLIITEEEKFILKKASIYEYVNYERYLFSNNFSTPKYFGKMGKNDEFWIVIEYIDGHELSDINEINAVKTADAISQIANEFFQYKESFTEEVRMNSYLERIEKRYNYAKSLEFIGEAYKLFLDRQKEVPRTLCNGDLLPMNIMEEKGNIKIIDWGFGGIMPYSLDVARFIAHSIKVDGWTFKSTPENNQVFIDRYFENLQGKINRETFERDIKLAILNEYVEFMEADEDESNWYRDNALKLSKQILKGDI